MKVGDSLRRQLQPGGDLFKVRPVIHDRYAVQSPGFSHRWSLCGQPLDGCAKRVVSCLLGVEVDGHAGVSGNRLAYIASLFQGGRERDGSSVQRGIELGAQFREERGVTQREYADARRRAFGAWRMQAR